MGREIKHRLPNWTYIALPAGRPKPELEGDITFNVRDRI